MRRLRLRKINSIQQPQQQQQLPTSGIASIDDLNDRQKKISNDTIQSLL
ncbi:MAG: hypothetical protein M3136_04580 [Thermoproteota archaeon]|nr:hypothetical protein [Thermoproteota archaeon]